ncbi:CPBP family intramembrane metalloprotease [Kocuria rhizophila]|uniref:CPBP family intramembrane glutamic endopeptidase n=1 Tax=Kocuria rhizophila TaxID=72000 RepID=UPI0021A8D5BC|nr:type II CAAX endopeptidase family protein [Kocuria rhizophila]MCT1457167.1 CPBP family intramembrane metalloprotease [Kocuria rhizophila]
MTGGVQPAARTRTYFYHRLARTDPHHRWWMPLVEGLILFGIFMVLSIMFGIVLALAFPETLTEDMLAANQLDPVVYFMLFASVALLLPSALLARLVLGPRPLGLIFSVTGRIRWKWLLLCFLVAVGVYAVVNLVGIGLDLATGGTPTSVQLAPGFGWLLATTLIVVPLQCTAEEVVFRGYLAQMVGRWLKHPAWAILLPVPLFVAGHVYDVWGLLSVAIMAVSMGIVTWRTGGLEAGIALHAVNNMTVSLFAMLGLVDMNETSGAPTDLITEVILNGAFIALVFWLVKRHPEVAVTRTVVLPQPPAPPRLPAVRPAAIAADRSGLAAYPYDPATQTYLSLPPQYGPYVVRDGQGRYVGVLDTRGPGEMQPTYTGPHDGQY